MRAAPAPAPAELPPGGLPAALCGDVPAHEKARIIWHEMCSAAAAADGHEATHVTRDRFVRTLAKLDTELTEATAEDMHSKLCALGDADERGLSFADVQRIASVYPTLFNVLAYRIMDSTMNARQVRIVDRENAILGELAVTSDALAAEGRGLHAQLSQRRQALLDAQDAVRDAEAASAAQRVSAQRAHRSTGDARETLAANLAREATLRAAAQARGEELGLPALEAAAAAARAAAAAAEDEAERTAQEIDAAEKKLAELKERLYAQRKGAFRAYDDATTAEEALEERAVGAAECTGAAEQAEREAEEGRATLKQQQEAEDAAGRELRRLAHESHAASDALRGCDAAVRDAEEAAARGDAEAEATAADCGEQRARVAELVEANKSFNALRRQQYNREVEVLHREVRLREQRDCLEEMEAALRTESLRVVPQQEQPPAAAAAAAKEQQQSAPTPAKSPQYYAGPVTPASPAQFVSTPMAVIGSPVKPAPLPSRSEHPRYSATGDHAGVERAAMPAHAPQLFSTPGAASARQAAPESAGADAAAPSPAASAAAAAVPPAYAASAPAAAAAATALHQAMKGLGTDEDAVYGVIDKVQTQADWEAVRARFKAAYPTFSGGDVVQALEDDLSAKELERCRQVLRRKGVTL